MRKTIITITILTGVFSPFFTITEVGAVANTSNTAFDQFNGVDAASRTSTQLTPEQEAAARASLQNQSEQINTQAIQEYGTSDQQNQSAVQNVYNSVPGSTNTSAPGTASNPLSTSGAAVTDKLALADKGFCTMNFLSSNFQPLNCIGYTLLKIGGVVVSIGGVFLNISIDYTVLNMSKVINGVGAINAAWKVFRDLANIFFIFILIYIAISTIIGTAGGQTQKMLINVIIVALLINFSMFFTKVAVDASNILTIQFFNSISKGDSSPDNGISWVFMNASRLTTIYQVGNTADSASAGGKVYTEYNFIIVGILGLLFSLVLAFVFMAIAIMFVSRFVTIIFLIVLSPIAFLGFAVNKLSGKWNQWLSTLIDQLFFAPVMMAMLWTVAIIVNSPGYQAATNFSDPNANFANLSTLPSISSSIYVVLSFILLTALLIGGLLISKDFSRSGTSFAMKIAGGATFGAAAWAGRKTGGWLGNKAAKSETLQKIAARNPTVGMFALKAAKGIASASFDARNIQNASDYLGKGSGAGGYSAALDKQIKQRQEDAKLLKDVKIYQDKGTAQAASNAKETSAKKEEEVVDINKKMADFLTKGGSTNDQFFKNLETLKIQAIKERDAAKKELESLQKDVSKTKTGEQTYAENLTKGGIAAIMTRIAAEREKAQEKIEEPYIKDRQKQETAWVEAEEIKRLTTSLASLKASLELVKSGASSVSKAVETLETELLENKRRIEKLTSDGSKSGADIIKINKERDILMARNAKINEDIQKVRNDEKVAQEAEKESLALRIDAASKQLATLTSKGDDKKILEALKKLTGSGETLTPKTEDKEDEEAGH